LWTVNVRRGQGQSPKYKQIKGGRTGLFGLDTLQDHGAAVITEGEFDAMLLHQETSDLVGVITLGSASPRHFETWLPWLLKVERLLVAYDNDAEGREGLEFWLETTKRAREMRVPEGKDVTDFWRSGGDLRAWTQYHLDRLGCKGAEMGRVERDPLLERLEAAWQEVGPGGSKADDPIARLNFETLLSTYERAPAAGDDRGENCL